MVIIVWGKIHNVTVQLTAPDEPPIDCSAIPAKLSSKSEGRPTGKPGAVLSGPSAAMMASNEKNE